MKAPLPDNEAARLQALQQYQILDTEPEAAFDDLTSLAAQICQAPTALICLVDDCRQWFKAKVGLTVSETPRDLAFCAHTILQPDLLIVPDALADPRFIQNLLVTDDPQIRFYAGVPLITSEGQALGTLCVIDFQPRELSSQQLEALQALGRQVVAQLELRRHLIELQRTTLERQQIEAQLQRQTLRSQLFADLTLKIRQSLDLAEILQTTVTEVQQFLQADRVLIFRLWSDGSGTVVKEAVGSGWPKILGGNIVDPCFEQGYVNQYRQGRVGTMTDLAKAEVEPCYREMLQKFGVKANLVVPILTKADLWGLLIAHQCDQPRQWSKFEIDLLRPLGDQMGIALAQAQLLEQETRQREELARSNHELQQFANVASHDLQEPLRKIQAFGDRLKLHHASGLTDQGQDYLARMQEAAKRMQTLINDLLTFSRVTTKAQPFGPVNLNQVVQGVLLDLEVRLEQTHGQVEVGEMPTLEADPLQMRQLFLNLISNALKFHRPSEPPQVKVKARLLDSPEQSTPATAEMEYCQITVADNGIGFDEKYLDRIFNVFERLHSRQAFAGTGMGLAICRRIAERHGGTISAKSIPGEGVIFTVTLPVNQYQGEPRS